jgi:hypothetical protein
MSLNFIVFWLIVFNKLSQLKLAQKTFCEIPKGVSVLFFKIPNSTRHSLPTLNCCPSLKTSFDK